MGGTRVRELFEAGEPFGDTIDAAAALSMDEKAALWLFAFSLRDQSDPKRAPLNAL